jgi:large subunit ribosomal protein L4
MSEALNKMVGEASVLLLLPGEDEKGNEVVKKSTNNLDFAKTLNANYLNIRDLLGYDKVLIPVSALETISAYLGA